MRGGDGNRGSASGPMWVSHRVSMFRLSENQGNQRLNEGDPYRKF